MPDQTQASSLHPTPCDLRLISAVRQGPEHPGIHDARYDIPIKTDDEIGLLVPEVAGSPGLDISLP